MRDVSVKIIVTKVRRQCTKKKYIYIYIYSECKKYSYSGDFY